MIPEDLRRNLGFEPVMEGPSSCWRKRRGRKYVRGDGQARLIGTAAVGATTMIFSTLVLMRIDVPETVKERVMVLSTEAA
jgi:hypothetical protein